MSAHEPYFDVLYEDNHLLAVVKPVMLPTMGVAEGRPSLLTVAKDYIRRKYAKPAGVYLGIVSRLDAPVSGVLIIARTSKSAARLTDQFRSHTVEKIYWAMIDGRIRPQDGKLFDHVRKDERHRKMKIATPNRVDALEARLSYRTVEFIRTYSHLEIQLETGRKHQIRLQMSHQGHPIVGDRKYGSRTPFPAGIALHCRRLTFDHPVRGHRMNLEAPLPKAWREFGMEG